MGAAGSHKTNRAGEQVGRVIGIEGGWKRRAFLNSWVGRCGGEEADENPDAVDGGGEKKHRSICILMLELDVGKENRDIKKQGRETYMLVA